MTAWTKTPPRGKPGYYWCRRPRHELEICTVEPDGRVCVVMGCEGYCSPEFIERTEMEFWPVPIPEPQDGES